MIRSMPYIVMVFGILTLLAVGMTPTVQFAPSELPQPSVLSEAPPPSEPSEPPPSPPEPPPPPEPSEPPPSPPAERSEPPPPPPPPEPSEPPPSSEAAPESMVETTSGFGYRITFQIVISLLVLCAALYVLVVRQDPPQWAAGAVGLILGHWFPG